MQAAVMNPEDGKLHLSEWPLAEAVDENQVILQMKAAAIKNLDRSIASGKHYSSSQHSGPKIIGGDGVGILPDGTRVYAIGTNGMIAERAAVQKNRMVRIPAALPDDIAAALPNAVMGSAMGLRFRANIQSGETVLINGATSVTGKVAIQIAKYYGAKKVIATGRNQSVLEELLSLGADEVISLSLSEEDFTKQIKAIHQHTPIDIIIDYLWGQSAELLLLSLKGQGSFTHPTRFVSIGSISGDNITLSAATLRSVDLQLLGSGLGSWTSAQVDKLFGEILPEMFQLAADGHLKIETIVIPLQEIESVYDESVPGGKRLVIKIR